MKNMLKLSGLMAQLVLLGTCLYLYNLKATMVLLVALALAACVFVYSCINFTKQASRNISIE